MRASPVKPVAADVRLAPHQVEFVQYVFAPGRSRVVQLVAPAGWGKSVALGAVARRALDNSDRARIIVVTPQALTREFSERLRSNGVAAEQVDRYRFRELIDSPKGAPWPEGKAFVLSSDFAKLPDVLGSLEKVNWDLLLIDELHQANGARLKALERIASTAKRVVGATATPVSSSKSLLLSDASTFRGSLPASPRSVQIHEIRYQLTLEERVVAEGAEELARHLRSRHGSERGLAGLLPSAAWSSPSALEQILNEVSRREARQSDSHEAAEVEGAPAMGGAPDGKASEAPAINRVSEVWARLGAVGSDSKLAALLAKLTEISATLAVQRNIIVTTEFPATLFYLAAAIENLGLREYSVYGDSRTEAQLEQVRRFEAEGGVLVVTAIPWESLQDLEVPDIILYDVPSRASATAVSLLSVVSVKERVDREIHAMIPVGIQNSRPRRMLKLLEKFLRGPLGREQV